MAWMAESRPILAEPPAESPSTMKISVREGSFSRQSASLPGIRLVSRALLRRTSSRAFLAAARARAACVSLGAAMPDAEGFVPLFNGKDLTGWVGATSSYGVETIKVKMAGTGEMKEMNVLACQPGKGSGGNLCTEKEFENFILRFEFCMPENGNNGLGLRMTDIHKDAAYHAMCELQLLDDGGDAYYDKAAKKDKLRPYQYTGSVYGIVPAKRDNFNKQIWGKDKNFTGGGSDTSDGQPVYENCYTYIDLPDMEGTITGISIIGSVADRYGGQWTGARVTLTNCYYLSATRTGISFDKVAQYKNPNASKKSLADLLSTQAARSAMLLGDLRYLGDHLWDYRTDTNRYGQTIYNFNGLTELTYSQMADRVGADGLIHTENTGSPQSYPDFRTALGAGYAWVTIAEGDASIHGKYSFPGEDAALQGQDYPFPTVLTQRSSLGETVSLHYGAWPKEGLFWSKGIASLDMIADYDDAAKRSAIRLALTLEGGGALPDGELRPGGLVRRGEGGHVGPTAQRAS